MVACMCFTCVCSGELGGQVQVHRQAVGLPCQVSSVGCRAGGRPCSPIVPQHRPWPGGFGARSRNQTQPRGMSYQPFTRSR